MQTACEGHYPHVLAGDSVARSVLDRRLDDFRGLTVDYISQASSLAWGSDCSGASNSVGFFVDYRKLFGDGVCTRDGSSLLAHDALLVFTQGVRNTELERPSRDAVLAGIANISSTGLGVLHAASGQIDYPRTGDQQAIPQNKVVLMLRGKAQMVPELLLLCGQLDTAQPPPGNSCSK